MNGKGSRMKGNRFELRIASIFSDAFDMEIRRVPASGGLDIKCDIYCPTDDTFPFYIECKHRETLRIESLVQGTSDLVGFFERNKAMGLKSYLYMKYIHEKVRPVVVFKGGDFRTDMIMIDCFWENEEWDLKNCSQIKITANEDLVLRTYRLSDFIEHCSKKRLY